jgi:hypothetical protein
VTARPKTKWNGGLVPAVTRTGLYEVKSRVSLCETDTPHDLPRISRAPPHQCGTRPEQSGVFKSHPQDSDRQPQRGLSTVQSGWWRSKAGVSGSDHDFVISALPWRFAPAFFAGSARLHRHTRLEKLISESVAHTMSSGTCRCFGRAGLLLLSVPAAPVCLPGICSQ